ncbi:MAG TPA: hypothetical protein VGJ04_03235, partial [Pirellulales bacterium]
MRRKWFRNGLGRKNSQANRQGQVWKTRSSPRSFSRTLERLEDRRLLAAITFSAGILTLNGDQDFAGENDNFALARDTSDPSKLNVTVNSDSAEYALSSITQINVFGFAGNDSLIVNSTNGLIKVQNGIQYDGGTGFDGLLLLGASTNTSDELDVGATPGAGRSLLENGPDFQEIYFQNLEPIIDQVLSSSFMIDAFGTASILNANNAINCTIASEGSITIDNFEPITFEFKDHLIIDSGAGDDTVNVSFQGEELPSGADFDTLQDITVNGQDPTASDTLIVNGTINSDTIDYRPGSTVGSGEVDINSNPAVIFNTMESVVIDGQGGNDALRYTTPSNDGQGSILTLTPSVDGDSSTVTGRPAFGASYVPLIFQHIGINGSIEFTSTNEGRADYLDVYGSSAADQFNLDPDDGGSLDMYRLDEPGDVRVAVEILTPSISTLALHGRDGDDEFNVVC